MCTLARQQRDISAMNTYWSRESDIASEVYIVALIDSRMHPPPLSAVATGAVPQGRGALCGVWSCTRASGAMSLRPQFARASSAARTRVQNEQTRRCLSEVRARARGQTAYESFLASFARCCKGAVGCARVPVAYVRRVSRRRLASAHSFCHAKT